MMSFLRLLFWQLKPHSLTFYYQGDNEKRSSNFEFHIDLAVQRAYIFVNEFPLKGVEGFNNFYL